MIMVFDIFKRGLEICKESFSVDNSFVSILSAIEYPIVICAG